MKLKLSEILASTGGRLLSGSPNTEISRFFTDSRQAGVGAMFVPIRGEKVDGHAYIQKAFAAGAIASFTDHLIEGMDEHGGALVLVEDCRRALQQAAADYRARFSLPIVGITGSVGKTSAKEMIAQGLTAGFSVMKTAGNQNSQVGVPITICGLKPEHTAAVVEMGVSMPGEMERIAQVVKPTCGVITTIGTSHIQFMKTRENILAQKAHMADYLSQGAPLFVNGDNDLLPGLASMQAKYRLVTFGLGESCMWRGEDILESENGTAFTAFSPNGRSCRVYIPVLGEHNVRNALAALAVADHLGQSLESTVKALGDYTPPAMRQQVKELGGVTVIDDSYNASPDSMCSAIDVLAGKQTAGKRAAVLADMLELGEYSEKGHFETGAYAKAAGIDLLIGVGPLAKEIVQGYGPGALWAEDNQTAAKLLLERLETGDAVLVKGSRGMKTEEIVEAIKDR